ncbi:MAG: ceramidase domain-containing protein, partial [Phycicoccus sp.]
PAESATVGEAPAAPTAPAAPGTPAALDRRPLWWAAVTAVVSLTAVLAAARWRWLGADAGRGGEFCEAAREGWLRQPVNTLSNLGFVLAGLAVAWFAADRLRLGLTLGSHVALAAAYAVLVVLLGPGSMAMHATQTDLGGHLDLLSMYLVSGFALAYVLMRWLGRGPALLVVAFTAAVVAGMAVHLRGGTVPVFGHVGNAAFAIELYGAVGLEVALWRRGRRGGGALQDARWGASSVLVLLVAFAVWTTGQDGHPWCDPSSLLQAHGLWHVLCAVSAYLLFRHYAAERAA